MLAFGGRVVEAVHRFEHMVGHRAVGAVQAAVADRTRHIGHADAAVIVGIAMGEGDFFPLAAGAASLTVPPNMFGSGTSREPALPCTSIFGSDVPPFASKLVMSVPTAPLAQVENACDMRRRLHLHDLAVLLLLVIVRSGYEMTADPVTLRIGPRSVMYAVK